MKNPRISRTGSPELPSLQTGQALPVPSQTDQATASSPTSPSTPIATGNVQRSILTQSAASAGKITFGFSAIPPELFRRRLPQAIAWAKDQEEFAMQEGQQLSQDGMALARQMGVSNPEKVRVIVGELPRSPSEKLKELMRNAGLDIESVAGLTFGHAVYLADPDGAFLSHLSHELCHVRQYEEHGSLELFLTEYVEQLIQYGYDNAPLELDATTHQIPDDDRGRTSVRNVLLSRQ